MSSEKLNLSKQQAALYLGGTAVASFGLGYLANQTISNNANRPQTYDVIVVGNGAGGSFCAKDLADAGYKVLNLEAGENQTDATVLNPSVATSVPSSIPGLTSNINRQLTSKSKYSINIPVVIGTSFFNLSYGRCWGGSTAHNYLTAVRGTHNTWDYMATASGNNRWAYSNILATMKEVETFNPVSITPASSRGLAGPIKVQQQAPLNQTHATWLAFQSQFNAGFALDYNDGSESSQSCLVSSQNLITAPLGSTTPPAQRSFVCNELFPIGTVIDADGNGLNGKKLKLQSNALVNRLIYRDAAQGDVEGVEYIVTNKNGSMESKKAYAKIIVLAASAVGTPAILERSGIGEAAKLQALGIPVVIDNSNVGKNGLNHYGWNLQINNIDIPSAANCWTDLGIGTRTVNNQTVTGDGIRRVQMNIARLGTSPNAMITMFLNTPQSPVTTHIVSRDPTHLPDVDAAIYSDSNGEDAKYMVDSIKKIKAIADQFGATMVFPGPSDFASDAAILAKIKDPSRMVFASHLSGTCRVAQNSTNGVVDGNLKVFGLKNVYIADLSAMPTTSDGNTCLPAYYIGKEVGKIVKQKLQTM